MFQPDLFIQLSQLPQRQIAAAVRIAAAIATEGHGITEKSARAILKCDDVVWAEFKMTLRPFFKWQIGRIDLIIKPEDRPLPFEVLTEEQIRKLDEAAVKRAAKTDTPLTPPQQRLYNLGGFTPAKARSFYFQMTRLYGPKAVDQALEIAEQNKPGQPQGFIISVLKKKAAAASSDAAPKRTFAIRVKLFERPVNPEAAKTQSLGWEAMVNQNEDGSPIWGPEGRRRVFRLATGDIRWEAPKAGEHIPSVAEDPGILVI